MPSKSMTTVLGQLAMTQVRYVSPVRPRAAQGLVGRVYEQIDQEFGVLAPPFTLHSPAPRALAACWLMLRETVLVTRKVDRAAKEAVATAISLANACPYCVSVHRTLLTGLAEPDTDPRIRAVSAWARDSATAERAGQHEPACPAEQAPELIGTAVLFHYYNRMVNVFLTELPLPPGTPKMSLGPVLWVLDRRLRPAAERSRQPGESVDLLPAASVAAAAALPDDLSWASGDPVIQDAFARGCAAIEEGGARSVPRPVRDLVLAELDNWHGEPRGPSRAWADSAVSGLPPADQPAGRLALLTALASAQVDRSVIQAFRASQPDDATLIELAAWASLAAARRAGTWIPVAAPDGPDAQ